MKKALTKYYEVLRQEIPLNYGNVDNIGSGNWVDMSLNTKKSLKK